MARNTGCQKGALGGIALGGLIMLAMAACQPHGPPLDAPPPRAPGDGLHVEVGAATVAPGDPLPIHAEGFPPGADVHVGLGHPSSDYSVVAEARTDADGRLETTLTVPGWAMTGMPYVIVVAERADEPRAVSEPFVVARPGDTLQVEGTLTDEGVECPALRGMGGELYTLATRDLEWGPGTDVRVEGRVAEVSFCMQGTTLEVIIIEPR
jgi:hypothetical protein